MVDNNKRQQLPEGCLVLENPSFDDSIVGVTLATPQRLIYSLDSMIEEFVQDAECSFEEAQEFIEYNTLRALPYMGEGAPLVMQRVSEV